jgi:hypothetical protein
MINDKDSHIPLPLIMLTCTVLPHALLEWQRRKVISRKLAIESRTRTDLLTRTTLITRMMVVRLHPAALQWVAGY